MDLNHHCFLEAPPSFTVALVGREAGGFSLIDMRYENRKARHEGRAIKRLQGEAMCQL